MSRTTRQGQQHENTTPGAPRRPQRAARPDSKHPNTTANNTQHQPALEWRESTAQRATTQAHQHSTTQEAPRKGRRPEKKNQQRTQQHRTAEHNKTQHNTAPESKVHEPSPTQAHHTQLGKTHNTPQTAAPHDTTHDNSQPRAPEPARGGGHHNEYTRKNKNQKTAHSTGGGGVDNATRHPTTGQNITPKRPHNTHQRKAEQHDNSIRRARVSLWTANRNLRSSQASLFYFFLPAAVSECVFLSFLQHCGNSEPSPPHFAHTFSDANSPRHLLAC